MKKNKKGFTLAELLIVVAIIAVLVAIAIPVFTSQLEKSRESTDLANIRTAYAALVVQYLDNASVAPIKVEAKQKAADWQTNNSTTYPLTVFSDGGQATINVSAKTTDYTVSIDSNGSITIS